MADSTDAITGNLESEISEIDAIHQETIFLFQKFKTLPASMLEKHFNMLVMHIKAHFNEEKRLMTLHHYNEIENHCAEHALMEQKLEEYRTHLDDTADLARIRKSLAEDYLDQLLKHIELSDTKMLSALTSHNSKVPI